MSEGYTGYTHIQIEYYSFEDRYAEIGRKVRTRYPAARTTRQNANTIIVDLNDQRFSDLEHQQFFGELYQNQVIANWRAVPPPEAPRPASLEKTTLHDIGVRVRSNKALTAKQATALFDERQDLERSNQKLQGELDALRPEYERLVESYGRNVERLNGLIELLQSTLQYRMFGKHDLWHVQSTQTGQILYSHADELEVLRLYLQDLVKQ